MRLSTEKMKGTKMNDVKKQIEYAIEHLQSLHFMSAKLTDISVGSEWLEKYNLIVKQVENIIKLTK